MTQPRILIVEDDPDTARLLECWLQTSRYQYIGTASLGQAAIALAGSTRPDLVIMDSVLRGDLEGAQTASVLHERFDLPVLYLTKPFNERELERAVEAMLDRLALVRRLKESEAHLAEAQAVAHIGSWHWDPIQDHVVASAELLRLFELSPGTFEPRFDSFLQRVCASDQPRIVQAVEVLLHGGDPADVEISMRCANGQQRILRLRGTAHFDASGKALELVGTALDITREWTARQEAKSYRIQLERKIAQRTTDLEASNSRLQAEIAEHLETEKDLWQSEARYHSLVENLPDAVIVLQDDHVIFANPAAARLAGVHKPDELLGQAMADLVHPDNRAFIEQRKQAALTRQTPNPLVAYSLLRSDGSAVDVESISFAFKYDGHPAFLAVIRDLTERRNIERAAERFRVALDSSPDAIFLIDPVAMGFIDVNETACNILGYSRAELLERGPHDIKPHYNKTLLRERFAEVLAGKPGAEIIQTLHQRKDGSTFPVEVRLRSFNSEGRHLMVAIARDVTARQLVDLQLSEANERFLQIAENVSEVFWIRDLDTDSFLYVSPAFEVLFQKPVSSVYRHPRSFLNAVHPEDRLRVSASFDWQRQHREGVDLEFRIIVGDNETHWLWVRTFPIRDLLGNVYRMAGVVEDVTQRREADEQYRTIIQASMDGFLVVDTQGQLLDCNEAYCRTLGYTREEMLRLSISELDHSESPEQIAWHIRRVAEQGQDRFETQHRHKNGQLIDMEVSAYYQPDSKGGRLFAFLRDITQRKRVDEAFRESELRYRSLIASLPGIAYRCALDADWTVEIFSGEVESLTGYPPSDFLEKRRSYASIIHPDDTALVERAVMDGVATRSRFKIEYRLCHADGRIVSVHENGHAVYDDNGKVVWLDGFIWNISERKQTEQALIESEEHYRAVVEDQTELISRLQQDGTFTFANEAYCRFFGKTEAELVGHTWHPVVFPADRPEVAAKLGTLSPSNPVVVIENRVFSGTGELHWMQFVNRAFFDGAGRVIEIQSVGRDITIQKTAELALWEAEDFKRAVLDAVSTQVAVLDQTGTIIAINESWRKFAVENSSVAGQAAAHTEIGVNYLHVCQEATGMSAEGAQEVGQGIRAVLDGSTNIFTYEYPCHAPHKQRWFMMTVTPLGSARGGVVVSHSDITAPRTLAEKLRQSEARSRSILRAAPVGIGVIVDRVFLEVNESMTTITGYSAEELIGQSSRMLYADQSDFDYVGTEKYRQIQAHGIGSVETRWRRKDGRMIEIALCSSPVVVDDLSLGVTFTAQDITATKRAELARLVHEASQRDALVREVHHRIKNNLQGVIGLLRQHIADYPDTQQPIEAAIAQVNTIAVVHGLQSRMPQHELRVRELLHEVNNAATALAMALLPIPIEDTLAGDVWLDSNVTVAIALILNELIQNALKHGQYVDGKGIKIALGGDGQRVAIHISNTGARLPDNFDLLAGQGCGTGLDLVRTLMPRRGAGLNIYCSGDRINAEFVLSPPVTVAPEHFVRTHSHPME